ncbi:hypothetical protein [Streptomyces hydrogenans]
MTASAGPTSRVGRNYTKARTHPWVLGKLGDFVLWFGPYNTGQLVIAAIGVLVLIKTFSWWSGLGPIPVLALGVLVWAARAQRIGGRAPMWVLYGLARRALQPTSGRIGGRTARSPRTRRLTGTLLIEHTTPPEAAAPADPARPAVPARAAADVRRSAPVPAVRPPGRRRPAASTPVKPAPPARGASPVRPGGGLGPAPTPLQQLLHDRSTTKAAR